MFPQAEINLMERQLLFLLNYNLSVTEEEVIAYAQPMLKQCSVNDLPPLSPTVMSPASYTQKVRIAPRLPSDVVQ